MYTNIVVTQRVFCPRKPVASKQPTCVESEREVNKVNGVLTETVKDWRHSGRHHPPITHRLSATLRNKSHASWVDGTPPALLW